MNKVPIPKEFELFGLTIKVEWQDDLAEVEDLVGRALYRQNKIVLQSKTGTYGDRSDEYFEETFLEELVHWIIHKIADDKENDHQFIKLLAGTLHQVFKTAKY